MEEREFVTVATAFERARLMPIPRSVPDRTATATRPAVRRNTWEARAPMAVTVIGGLITSTLLTLVVVPVVYTFMEKLTHSAPMRWLGRKLMGTDDSASEHPVARRPSHHELPSAGE